ncbi:MAG: CoA activase [Nitrospinae bacterium]|nr:CoA activase [Nitrospinota bacterium]
MSDLYLGIDIGSISVKAVLMDGEKGIIRHIYRRMYGKPLPVLSEILEELHREFPASAIARCGATGTGGELAATLIGGEFFNEVVAQSRAIGFLHPEVRTVIEMGGQDSKLLIMKPHSEKGAVLEDFAMNTVCAAGTGSFLDQQATRLGYPIEKEFGEMALRSKNPPRIAGRCSVFAKSDMIHLQQVGTPDFEIVAGLCFAVARSFKGNIARGKSFIKPVAFIGGVASNAGVVRGFERELELAEGELIIPALHNVTGAIGAALGAMESVVQKKYVGPGRIAEYLGVRRAVESALAPIRHEDNGHAYDITVHPVTRGAEVFIGVDIGSLSTNVVALDVNLNVVARRYLRTSGRPIEVVAQGLREIGEEIAGKVVVKGVGTTGSGRYMIGDYVGADAVRNEITAQATAAVHFIPDCDTIFEIGGQDSKYISILDGAVVDFEMNKVCAAGTGSFIEEQAERLDLDIKADFSNAAFSADRPGKFGERCTVFIESDLIAHQQKGSPSADLAAGLAYSIVKNYLQVVGDRKVGDKVLFQGGVAWNKAVVAAFSKVTGKTIHIPPHHDVTGAIGAAIIAARYMKNRPGLASRFKGFDLSNRKYKVSSFECKACDNVCGVSRVKFEDEPAHYYGARCELFEKDHKKAGDGLPDLFAEREKLLFGDYLEKKAPVRDGRKVVGIPRVLTAWELFPFWSAFLEELGCEVVLSGKTNQQVIHDAVELVTAETCFPIKIIHGHVADLVKKGVDAVFMPSVITLGPKETKFKASQMCPYVQASSAIVKGAADLAGEKVELWEPPVRFTRGDAKVVDDLLAIGKRLGVSRAKVAGAVKKARAAQNRFAEALVRRGGEVIGGLKEERKAVVIISRPYNGCDSGINMDLPRKLKDMGMTAIPIDMLPLDEDVVHAENPHMYWRSGQRLQAAAEAVRKNHKLNAIYISNFKCGPDSFITYHVQQQLRGKPYLHLEVDEHSADAGAITRCEAFFDSLENVDAAKYAARGRMAPPRSNGKGRTIFLPYMCDQAYILAGAFRRYGIHAEVLPKTDQASLELGRRFSNGKECIPYTLTTGDILKKAMEKDFDPKRSTFFMPSTDGPCRFGQYNSVLRLQLDKLGHFETNMMSPNAEGSYDGFSEIAGDFRRLAWRGVVAVDILQKLLHETRPYEKVPGSTEKAYQTALDLVVRSIEGGGKDIFKRMYDVRDIFTAVAADRTARRPIIGVVGEIYVRLHSFSNNNIARQIEDLGGEAWTAPFGEWVLYCADRFIARGKRDGNLLNIFSGWIFNAATHADEKKIVEPFKGILLNWHEPATRELLERSKPYLDAAVEGEAILSVAKAVDYAEKGCAGIVNLLPFSCMPGTIVSALSKKVREDLGNIPWLNVDIDGMDENNGRSRLEAFVFQAKQYRERKTAAV